MKMRKKKKKFYFNRLCKVIQGGGIIRIETIINESITVFIFPEQTATFFNFIFFLLGFFLLIFSPFSDKNFNGCSQKEKKSLY